MWEPWLHNTYSVLRENVMISRASVLWDCVANGCAGGCENWGVLVARSPAGGVRQPSNHLTRGACPSGTIGLLWNCILSRGHDKSIGMMGAASVTRSLPARSPCKSGCHGSQLQVATSSVARERSCGCFRQLFAAAEHVGRKRRCRGSYRYQPNHRFSNLTENSTFFFDVNYFHSVPWKWIQVYVRQHWKYI